MMLSDGLTWLGSERGLHALLAADPMLGILTVAAVVFCETGLVILPFLPGDSLLFATGAVLGAGMHSPWLAMGAVTMAAVLGDAVNYRIGRGAAGQRLLRRGWIRPVHLCRTRDFLDRHGAAAIILGRFVPIVRTIAPFLAGLTGMNGRHFALCNGVGALAWAAGLMGLGFWLGQVAWVRSHLELLSLLIVTISVLPAGAHWLKRDRI